MAKSRSALAKKRFHSKGSYFQAQAKARREYIKSNGRRGKAFVWKGNRYAAKPHSSFTVVYKKTGKARGRALASEEYTDEEEDLYDDDDEDLYGNGGDEFVDDDPSRSRQSRRSPRSLRLPQRPRGVGGADFVTDINEW